MNPRTLASEYSGIFKSKTILITGGTGTFGNAVASIASQLGFGEIRIFSRDEEKQSRMRERLSDPRITFHLGDVRNYDSILQVMRGGVDIVFHAAALKQVPSCELFPMEAIQTNAIGADNVMRAAIHACVGKVVVLSTDKAVYPVNAMGMSKALMEKCMLARARMYSHPPYAILCGTRYGNVMASRGSVIPLFISQARAGKPLTVTDPEMTRFIMTIEDAVRLVFYAFVHGQRGDIYVQKSPAVTIGTLAQSIVNLMGGTNAVRVIGTRRGEKRHETLLNREEMTRAVDCGEYYRVPMGRDGIEYSEFVSAGQSGVSESSDYNSSGARRIDETEMMQMLLKLDMERD